MTILGVWVGLGLASTYFSIARTKCSTASRYSQIPVLALVLQRLTLRLPVLTLVLPRLSLRFPVLNLVLPRVNSQYLLCQD